MEVVWKAAPTEGDVTIHHTNIAGVQISYCYGPARHFSGLGKNGYVWVADGQVCSGEWGARNKAIAGAITRNSNKIAELVALIPSLNEALEFAEQEFLI